MELDLQSLFGLHVHSCTDWLRLRNPPPAFGLIDDIYCIVTLWLEYTKLAWVSTQISRGN
jgi:hypothetical protein